MEKKEKQISRKDFIKGVGTSLAGVTVLGGMGLMAGCSEGADSSATDKSTPDWPFPYVTLDPDKVADRTYKAYKEMGG
ncbi:hypothetical protein PRVXT_001177 [Proteinivorax tanatarense]|uniref:Uncharacterized protein n=1 Tax=Proteinivorax tanatarense TaxID=1260629 RepID=A0AAU7VPF2_9FIRM